MSLRGLVLVIPMILGVLLVGTAPALAACPNEALRAEQGDQHLPDCRAYELVTPSEKGATTPLWEANEAVAADGNAIWVSGSAYIGANPTPTGVNAVMSRTAAGWKLTSLAAPGAGDTTYEADIFNPNLTLLGAETFVANHVRGNSLERSFMVGSPGGPYTTIASTLDQEIAGALEGHGHFDYLAGASEDFSHVVLASEDHALAPGGTETIAEAHDLYEWSQATGKLQLVNVTTGGSLLSDCGATVGEETTIVSSPGFRNPVSSDGSKIFFTAPERDMSASSEPACQEPQHLYMRLDGRETVDISAPQPGVSDPTGYHPVHFVGATPDGTHVWFVTETELTGDDTGHAEELYEYNTVTRKLVRISAVQLAQGANNEENHMVFSEGGASVYFQNAGSIYRYDTATGTTRYVATPERGGNGNVEMAISADGAALVFWASDTTGPKGFEYTGGWEQVFRYDAAEESLICVSCPAKGTPIEGDSFLPYTELIHSNFFNGLETAHPVSDGGRYVFFSSDDALVPQDDTPYREEGSINSATDVYEWESEGTGSCAEPEGCISLISTPDSGHGSYFMGAGADGRDLFFLTYSALVPQDQDTVGDVYDARIDGGFAAPNTTPCSGEGCRLVPNAAPVFGTPQSAAFFGAGNPSLQPPTKGAAVKHEKTKKKVKQRHKGKGKKQRAKAHKGRKAQRKGAARPGALIASTTNGRGR